MDQRRWTSPCWTAPRPAQRSSALRGQLDIETAPLMQAALADLMGRGVTRVVIDLSGLGSATRSACRASCWSSGSATTPAATSGWPSRYVPRAGTHRAGAGRADPGVRAADPGLRGQRRGRGCGTHRPPSPRSSIMSPYVNLSATSAVGACRFVRMRLDAAGTSERGRRPCRTSHPAGPARRSADTAVTPASSSVR